MPPQVTTTVLPGVQNQDYRFISHGGRIYVVYSVKLPNGRTTQMSWRVDPESYDAFGINKDRVQTLGRSQFERLNFFGNATEIIGGDPGEHPFQAYLRRLREINGNISWLGDREVMGTMLMGYLEGWSDQEMLSAVQQSGWYQNRTEAQRTWEMTMTRAERKASVETWTTRMTDALQNQLYGAEAFEEAGIGNLQKQAERIASGRFGDPSAGFELWLAQERTRAERVEGSLAWIERQRQDEDQRQFLNRPEDMYEQLRQQAMSWVGPAALPDNGVLRDWSERLVSGVASEADWQQWIQQQAQALYPFLGPNEMWQDRASAYKRITEETWGMPIGWDHEALQHLGDVGPDGTPTGGAMSYSDFTRYVRSQPQFWEGPVARQQGFDLGNQLNSIFNGVTA